MILLGEYQTLTIKRTMPQGLYLSDDEGNEVLLPRAYVTENMTEDVKIEVFVYSDANEMDIATTEKPLLSIGKFACLKVNDVNKIGAFCDWGLSKELLIPYRNQRNELSTGQSTVVCMYVDERSDRLVGTTKINRFLKQLADENIVKGQKVDLLVYSRSDLGYNVIIDQTYAGLIYKNEVMAPLKVGQELEGYIKPIREDGKLDISLQKIGHLSIEPNAQMILDKLKNNSGFLPFTDKSDPDSIRNEFGISKKLFKKALGALYRQKAVVLKEDGIHAVEV